MRNGIGQKRSAYEGELELAYSLPNYLYGVEMFIPFANIPSPSGTGREIGIGDIEFRPLKLALHNSPEFVLSTATAMRAPTGRKRRGLGEGEWSGTQFLFSDFARDNWYAGGNVGFETNLTGPQTAGVEYGIAWAYSFIRGTEPGSVAKVQAEQSWVISPSVELIGTRGLRGEKAGKVSLAVVPGLTFWDHPSGWQIRLGIGASVLGERKNDAMVLVQIGNHLNWDRLLGLAEQSH